MLGRHTDVEFVRNGVADFNLRHDRLVFAVVGDEQPTFLENAALSVASDNPVILEGYAAAVRQLPNPFSVNHSGERRVRYGGYENTDEEFAGAAIKRTLRLFRGLGGAKIDWQDEGYRKQKRGTLFLRSLPVRCDYARFTEFRRP